MKYTEEELCEMNLHFLRTIAREMGVKSPTKYNKNELMAEIIKIENGEKEPVEYNRRGRPLKNTVATVCSEETMENIRAEIKKEMIEKTLKKVETMLNEIL
jgi:hypothetical protein